MGSIIHNGEYCYLCGMRASETHHCLHGQSRKKADEYGLTVNLCRNCHQALHDKGTYDRELQKLAQTHYEAKIGTRADFIKDFRKSYL